MKKITKARFDLVGKTIYRERTDCEQYELTAWSETHGWYETDDKDMVLTPYDLIGDYIIGE